MKLFHFWAALGLVWGVSHTGFSRPLELGQPVPDLCWQDSADKKVCLSDNAASVRVLIYATGWCPDCKADTAALVHRYDELANLNVRLYDLMVQGFEYGKPATLADMKQWISDFSVPWIVAASPKDAGRIFFDPPYAVPSTVIIDTKGNLAKREKGMALNDLVATVRELLE